MTETNNIKTYAAGLPGFGATGPTGNPGVNGLSIYFTNFDALNASDEAFIRTRILENDSLIRTSLEKIPGYSDGRRYKAGDYIIDKNSNVYVITLNNEVYESLGFTYAVPNIFYTNDDVNDFGYLKYYNLYYGNDKFLVDSIYTDKIFNSSIYNKSVYNTILGDYAKVNYVDVDNTLSLTNNKIQPFAVFASSAIDDNQTLAIVKETSKSGESLFRIGNVDENFEPRNTNLSLDFKSVSFPENTTLNGKKILSEYEINLGNFADNIFNNNPSSFTITDQRIEDNFFYFTVNWVIKDFFKDLKMYSDELRTSFFPSLNIFKQIETGTDGIIDLSAVSADNLIISDIDIKGDYKIKVPLEEGTSSKNTWYVFIEIMDVKTGWVRNSVTKTLYSTSETFNIHMINSKYNDVSVSSKFIIKPSSGQELTISNNIPTVNLNRCSATSLGNSPKNLEDIIIDTSKINSGSGQDKSNVYVVFTVNNTVVEKQLTHDDLAKKYITLDILPDSSTTFAEVFFEEEPNEDSMYVKGPSVDEYSKDFYIRIANKTNMYISLDELYKHNINGDSIINKAKLSDTSVNVLAPYTYLDIPAKHNFINYDKLIILPNSVNFDTRLLLQGKETFSGYFSLSARQNRNPMTYDYGAKSYNKNSAAVTKINNLLNKKIYTFLYQSSFDWHHDNYWDARYLKDQSIQRTDIIFKFKRKETSNATEANISVVYNVPYTIKHATKSAWGGAFNDDHITGTTQVLPLNFETFTYNNALINYENYELEDIEYYLIMRYGINQDADTYPLKVSSTFNIWTGVDKTISIPSDNILESFKSKLYITENDLNNVESYKDSNPLLYLNITNYAYDNILSNINYDKNKLIFDFSIATNISINNNITIGYDNSYIKNVISNGTWQSISYPNSAGFSSLYSASNIKNTSDYTNWNNIPELISGLTVNKFSLARDTFDALPGKLSYQYLNYDITYENAVKFKNEFKLLTNVVKNNNKTITYELY